MGKRKGGGEGSLNIDKSLRPRKRKLSGVRPPLRRPSVRPSRTDRRRRRKEFSGRKLHSLLQFLLLPLQ